MRGARAWRDEVGKSGALSILTVRGCRRAYKTGLLRSIEWTLALSGVFGILIPS